MKKAVVVIIVLAALGLVYSLSNNPSKVTNVSNNNESSSVKPDPSNATFIFEDGPITLSGGKTTIDIEGSSVLKEDVSLWGNFIAYGDINSDKKEDAAVIITRTGGGSGFFIYVAPFYSKAGSYKGGNAVFLGDRVAPKDISIADGILTVEYMDRAEGEPMAAEPTVLKSEQFKIKNGILEKL